MNYFSRRARGIFHIRGKSIRKRMLEKVRAKQSMRSWTKEILTENKYDIGNKRNGEQTQHKEQRSLTEKG